MALATSQMMDQSEDVPAAPRGNDRVFLPSRDCRYVTLHLYRPSGEFVIENVVPIGRSVYWYWDALEHGMVTPRLCIGNMRMSMALTIDDRIAGEDFDKRFFFDLVWNGMILEYEGTFADLVENHGMSVDEPVDVMVVLRGFPPPDLVADGRWMVAA